MLYICIYTVTCTCKRVYTFIMYLDTCIYLKKHIYIYINMYVSMYVSKKAYMYINKHIYIYVCT